MESKVGYRKTEFGWIPDHWILESFRTTVSISNGQVDPRDERYISIPLVGPNHIETESGRIIEWESVQSQNAKSGKYFVNSGEVIYSKIRPNLRKAAIVDRDCLCSADIYPIKGKSRVANDYLLLILLSDQFSKYAIRHSGRTGIPKINRNDLLEYRFLLPPLPEQQKIAEILSTWDTAIERTQALIAAKEEQLKGLMQRLLKGKVRVKGFDKEWKEVNLKQIAERITRKNEELNDNVVTISAQKGFVRQEEFFNKRVAGDMLSHYYLVERGDYCYNKSYSGGYPMGAFKRLDDYEKAVVTTLYICFRLKENMVDSDFMLNYFEAGLMIRGLMKIAQEGGRAHGLLNIGLSDFFDLKLTLPSLKEQKAIGKILRIADAEVKLYQQRLEMLKEQKKGLMQRLLSGRVRVKIDTDAKK